MSFGIKVDNLRDVQKSLRAADPALQKQFSKELRVLVKEIVVEAKTAGSWSTKIPPAISSTVTVTRAGIKVGRKNGPFPILNELGSKGSRGTIRHPLFGNRDHWYSQGTRPVVVPAVEANKFKFRLAAERAARDALKEAGI